MRVSWPQSATTEKNDIALKMMASEPKLAGSMDREASANMVKPSTDAVNLRVKAAALPFNTGLSRKYLAIFLTMSPSLMVIEAGAADIASGGKRPRATICRFCALGKGELQSWYMRTQR